MYSQVQYYFKNSFKQALCLEYGHSKAAMNVSKESHGRLWDSVCSANYALFHQCQQELPNLSLETLSMIPIRLYVNARPPIQKACRSKDWTLGQLLHAWLPESFDCNKPEVDAPNGNHNNGNSSSYNPREGVVCWRVAGIQPSLETPVVELFSTCFSPDHFLYIVVLTNS